MEWLHREPRHFGWTEDWVCTGQNWCERNDSATLRECRN